MRGIYWLVSLFTTLKMGLGRSYRKWTEAHWGHTVCMQMAAYGTVCGKHLIKWHDIQINSTENLQSSREGHIQNKNVPSQQTPCKQTDHTYRWGGAHGTWPIITIRSTSEHIKWIQSELDLPHTNSPMAQCSTEGPWFWKCWVGLGTWQVGSDEQKEICLHLCTSQ